MFKANIDKLIKSYNDEYIVARLLNISYEYDKDMFRGCVEDDIIDAMIENRGFINTAESLCERFIIMSNRTLTNNENDIKW